LIDTSSARPWGAASASASSSSAKSLDVLDAFARRSMPRASRLARNGWRIPKHTRKELEAYLSCGLRCRGFACLKCEDCGEKRLVAFSCKGRGFCDSVGIRRNERSALNLPARL
jgi:hypothetical protein